MGFGVSDSYYECEKCGYYMCRCSWTQKERDLTLRVGALESANMDLHKQLTRLEAREQEAREMCNKAVAQATRLGKELALHEHTKFDTMSFGEVQYTLGKNPDGEVIAGWFKIRNGAMVKLIMKMLDIPNAG